MDSGITITLPNIVSVVITPNPALTSASISITVTVSEISKTLYPQEIYSGEFYSSEI